MEFCGAGSVSDLMKIRNKTVSGECCVDVHICNAPIKVNPVRGECGQGAGI